MIWRDYLSPVEYTPIAQFMTSFSLGVIFSAWTLSLVIVIAFVVIYEAFIYAILDGHREGQAWQINVRIGVIMAYIMGWIVGRTVYGLDLSFISPEDDHDRLGKHTLCKRYHRRNNGRNDESEYIRKLT